MALADDWWMNSRWSMVIGGGYATSKWQRFDVYQLFVAQVVCWLCALAPSAIQLVCGDVWVKLQPTHQSLSCLWPTPTWTGCCLKNTTYRRRKSVLHLFMSEPLIKQSLVESAKCDFAILKWVDNMLACRFPEFSSSWVWCRVNDPLFLQLLASVRII